MKKIFLLVLLGNVALTAFGQNVGIGTSNPNAPLQFSNSIQNRKIVLYEGLNNENQFYGFGINGSVLRYQVSSLWDNHIFYAGVSPSASNELMRITGMGDMGLGITSPQNKLDINNGFPRTGSHPAGLSLYVTGNFGGADNGVEFRHDNASQGIGFGFNTIYATGANADQDLGMAARGANGSLVFSTNATAAMRITGAGNIGIGTYFPNAPLQFSNSVQNRKVVLYESANNDHQFLGLGINGATLRYQVSSIGDSHVFYAGASPSASNELMRINGFGYVGIGTATPSQKLDVNGNVNVSGLLLVGYEILWSEEVSVAPLSSGSATCNCSPGKVVIGGGFSLKFSNANSMAQSSPISSTAWRAAFYNENLDNNTIRAFAICARIGQ